MTYRMLCAVIAALPTVATAQVTINEFCYDHQGYDVDEFVELYNAGPMAVDLTGWVIDAEDSSFPSSNNQDVTLPPGTMIPAGGYLVVINDRSTMAIPMGVPTVAYFDTSTGCDSATNPNPDPLKACGWLENGPEDSIILRDNLGAIVDAVCYETNGDATGIDPERIEGAGCAGSLRTTPYTIGTGGPGGLTTYQRISDGFDTGDNGRDFRFSIATPGATNDFTYDLSATAYIMNAEIAGLMNGDELPRWSASCFEPEVVDYTSAGVPPSPFDDNGMGQPLAGALLAQMGCQVFVGSTWLEAAPRTHLVFEAFVYIESSPSGAANGLERWHIGLQGTSADFGNLPQPVSGQNFGSDVTGAGLSFIANASGATLYLVDYSNGSTATVLGSMAAPATGWHRVRIMATSGAIEARIGGTYGLDDGTAMRGPIVADGGFGGVYCLYGADNLVRPMSPLFMDDIVVTVPNASADCFGTPTANSLSVPQLSINSLPYVNNPSFAYGIEGAVPNSGSMPVVQFGIPLNPPLDFGNLPPGFSFPVPDGLQLWVLPIVNLPATTDASGAGTVPLPLVSSTPPDPGLFGLQYWAQLVEVDPGLLSPTVTIPVASSKAIRITIGPF